MQKLKKKIEDIFLKLLLKQDFHEIEISEIQKKTKIPSKKFLSSEKYRHVQADELLVTDHPYALSDDPSKDIHNIPKWIHLWLKERFLNNYNHYLFKKDLPKIFTEH